jgi:hypothetical protein
MAVRLVNLHSQPLRVELRGGSVLMLPAGARSAALREELLYDNDHIAEWERAGWLRRLPARMSDVQAEPPVAAPAAAASDLAKAQEQAAAAPPATRSRAPRSRTPKPARR